MSTARLRSLIPSLADVFLVSVVVWQFMTGYGWGRLLIDGDTGLHIRIGDMVLADGRVPDHDPFGFSRAGEPWFAFEWLSGVVFSVFHSSFGLQGVLALSAAVLAGAVLLLLRFLLWRGTSAIIAIPLVLSAATASYIHYLARPHIFTLLLVVIATWMLERDRRKQTRWLWTLVPITVIWANLHPGFPIFFILLALRIAGTVLEAWWWPEVRTERSAAAKRYIVLAAACAAATIVNPYGIQLPLHVGDVIQAGWIRDFPGEFDSPRFRSEYLTHFMVLLFAGLAVTGPLLSRRRIADVLWIAALGCAALTSVRHVPLYVMVATPILADVLQAYWAQWTSKKPRASIGAVLADLGTSMNGHMSRNSIWAAVFVIALFHPRFPTRWPKDLKESEAPAALVARNADLLTASRVFSLHDWNDYLIYRLYPRQRVFLDGRIQYYGEQIVKDYDKIRGAGPGWRDLASHYGIDVVLAPSDSPLISVLENEAGWVKKDSDERASLFVRSGREAAAVLGVGR